MRTLAFAAVAAIIVGFAPSWVVAQEKAPAKITIQVPGTGHADTIVSVNGKKLKGTDTTRKYVSAPVPTDVATSFEVKAVIEPNNYTTITRVRTVKVKGGGEATIDLTVKDPKTDKIVVRWVPTPDDIVDKMAEMAKIGKDDVVYDLGCGDAVMLIRPIKMLGAKKGVGIDIDPKMIAKAKAKAKEEGVENRVELRVGDILNVKDMSDATAVLLYIGDDLGERVGPVLKRTLKPGARIVSHRFTLGDWTPTRTVTVTGKDGYEYTLHLWIVGDKK